MLGFESCYPWLDQHCKLAGAEIQNKFHPDWSERYADQFHNVYEYKDSYLIVEEDGPQGCGLYFFKHGDWSLKKAAYIDTRKTGWSLRVKLARHPF